MMQNATGDLPQFTSSAYGRASSYVGNDVFNVNQIGTAIQDMVPRTPANLAGYGRPQHQQELIQQTKQESVMSTQKRRFVQVIVADPNENIPLENCLLYKGDPKLTDSTDQELYFELDIKQLLDTHNKIRTTFKDKKVKERVELLEPAKVRDLKMVVVTIAEL
jgi:hypothetical protein